MIIENKKMTLIEKIVVISMAIGPGLSLSKIYLYHVMLIILLVYFLRKNINIKYKDIKKNTILILIYIFIFFRMFFSKNIKYAIDYQIYLTLGLSVYILTLYFLDKNSEITQKIIKNTVIASIIVSLFEIFKITRWYNSYYLVSDGRPAAFYGNMNDYAVLLVMVFPFIQIYKNKIKKIILSVILIYILLKCDSRAANLAFILEVILILYFNVKNKILLYIFGIFFSIFSFKFILLKLKFLFDFFKFNSLEQDSIGVRQSIIKLLIMELSKIDVLFFGIGGGNTIVLLENAKIKVLSAHSFLLQLLVEYGIFIFILFGVFYIQLLIKNYKIKTKYNQSILIALIGFLISVNSMSGAIYYFPMWILLGIAKSDIKVGEK